MVQWNAYVLCFQRQTRFNFVDKKRETHFIRLKFSIVQQFALRHYRNEKYGKGNKTTKGNNQSSSMFPWPPPLSADVVVQDTFFLQLLSQPLDLPFLLVELLPIEIPFFL